MRDVALKESSDKHRKKYRPVLCIDIDEIPQPHHVAVRGGSGIAPVSLVRRKRTGAVLVTAHRP
jgi:hypothetical protein